MKKILLIFICSLLINQFAFSQVLSLKQITYSDSTHDGYPYWSPDGKYIIYSSGTRTTCLTKKINSEGGKSMNITESFAQHARWSPDGHYIVFDGYFGKSLKLMSAFGGSSIRIDPDSIPIFRSGMPCWAPDSRHIAFDSQGAIYIMDLDSGICKKTFEIPGKICIAFDWTNDGNSILADVRDTADRKQSDIFLINIKSGKAKQLTFLEGKQVKPHFSPDDSMIVFTSNHGGNADLWVMAADGGKPIQLTFYKGVEGGNPGYDIEASWSPDGSKIAFSSSRSDYWAVWVMKIDNEALKKKLAKQ